MQILLQVTRIESRVTSSICLQIFVEIDRMYPVDFELIMKCVICKKEIESNEFIPFCSSRCRNIYLNRWFNEIYVVPDGNIEKSAGQDQQIDLYENMNCPDSSVGRAED